MPEFTTPSPEDRFADALDALSLGLPGQGSGDRSLVDAARAIGMLGAPTDGDFDHPPVPLDLATKRQIWTDLMRERGGQAEASPVPQSPGAAGSTLASNPWVAQPHPKPKRLRPSGVLRFVPAAQPASTFMLVVAVLALVGGAFASLGPNGGHGVFPTALATEDSGLLASTSPEASPATESCAVDASIDETGEPLPDRLYRASAYGVPELHEIYVSNRWEQIVACGGLAGAGEIPPALMTDRRTGEEATVWIVTEDEANAILGYPPAWHELEAMERVYENTFDANPGFLGDPLALDADLGVYRSLADGRVAFYSGAWWLAEDGRIEPATDPAAGTRVTVHIFAQENRHWLYDETLLLCTGPCAGFETAGAPMPRLTVATPDASNEQWLSPLMNQDCSLSAEERAATPPPPPSVVTDPADYVPFAEADRADQIAVADTYLRIVSGCDGPGDVSLVVDGGRVILGASGGTGGAQSQVDTAQAITEELGYTDDFEILIANEHPQMITDGEGISTVHPSHVLLPEDVVRLPDGRLGGMLRLQIWSHPGEAWEWGGVAPCSSPSRRSTANGRGRNRS